MGIQEGLAEFLGGPGVIYTSPRLRDFCFDSTTQRRIAENLAPLQLPGTEDFAEDVCQEYRGFVYNDSLALQRNSVSVLLDEYVQ